MRWKSGDIFRCSSPSCECEVTINEPPRPGRTDMPIPSCCACGTPMLVKDGSFEAPPTESRDEV